VLANLSSGLDEALPLICFEFTDSSFTCHTPSLSGQLDTTLRSFNHDAIISAAPSVTGLPFNVTAVHTQMVVVATPTAPYKKLGPIEGAGIGAAIAIATGIAISVLGIAWWWCRRKGK
jgi:hypothetical protein